MSLNADIVKVVKDLNKEMWDTTFEYIQTVQKEKQDYMEVLVITDVNGKVVMDSQIKEHDIDLSDRDYMKKALSGYMKLLVNY